MEGTFPSTPSLPVFPAWTKKHCLSAALENKKLSLFLLLKSGNEKRQKKKKKIPQETVYIYITCFYLQHPASPCFLFFLQAFNCDTAHSLKKKESYANKNTKLFFLTVWNIFIKTPQQRTTLRQQSSILTTASLLWKSTYQPPAFQH